MWLRCFHSIRANDFYKIVTSCLHERKDKERINSPNEYFCQLLNMCSRALPLSQRELKQSVNTKQNFILFFPLHLLPNSFFIIILWKKNVFHESSSWLQIQSIWKLEVIFFPYVSHHKNDKSSWIFLLYWNIITFI